MSFQIIDGKKISARIKEEIKSKIEEKGMEPCLAVVLCGLDAASKIYVKNKQKACELVGIKSLTFEFDENCEQLELLNLIDELNHDKTVHGILVQLPLPKHIDESLILNRILPIKDVDGFHPENVGKLVVGDDCLLPCTPAGIIELIKETDIDISGKNCVVLGRSNIVGKPISLLVLQENATVTICHSKTENLAEHTKRADIVIASIGRPNFLKADMIKEGSVLIDVGINRLENNKIVGDIDFEDCKGKALAITPVPGGVGPMTIAMLMKNCVKAYEMQK